MNQYTVPHEVTSDVSSLYPKANGITVHQGQVISCSCVRCFITPAVCIVVRRVDDCPPTSMVNVVKYTELCDAEGIWDCCTASLSKVLVIV